VKKPQNEVPFDAISTASAIVGLPARQTIPPAVPITLTMFQTQGSTSNKEVLRALDPGFRAMAVQVDQVTGVGTIIQPGDRIDVVIAFEDTDGKFPIVMEGPSSRTGTPPQEIRTFEVVDDKLNNTSVKVLVQDAKVLGTLLPPPPAQETSGATPAPTTATGEVSLNGQQQIVIVQLTPQQVELVRFAQLDGNLSLVLRAVRDRDQPPVPTTGITLFELVQRWGVLPGQMTLQAPPPPK
jgi:Flp pilus assembly protein CpaB